MAIDLTIFLLLIGINTMSRLKCYVRKNCSCQALNYNVLFGYYWNNLTTIISTDVAIHITICFEHLHKITVKFLSIRYKSAVRKCNCLFQCCIYISVHLSNTNFPKQTKRNDKIHSTISKTLEYQES